VRVRFYFWLERHVGRSELPLLFDSLSVGRPAPWRILTSLLLNQPSITRVGEGVKHEGTRATANGPALQLGRS
jgi:hypothetical protein